MKKILSLVLDFALLLICFSGCGGQTLKKPSDTNLELWITEDVTNFDFSDFYKEPGNIEPFAYYGSDYEPVGFEEDNDPILPEHKVVYLVGSYPDHSSKRQHVVGITITDPSITFYGITLESDKEEIKKAMIANGFELVFEADSSLVYSLYFKLDNISFRFYEDYIYISAKVTNKDGVQY